MSIITIALALSYILSMPFTKMEYVIMACLMIIPASEVVIALINWSVGKLMPIRFVPKMDFSNEVPRKEKTIIVVPAILSSSDRTKELINKLEVTYLSNKDKNLYFALLGDLPDSISERDSKDEKIIKTGIDEILKLNVKYCENEKHFFFLSRKRYFNSKEGVYMGKERKRGKLLEFMALIKEKKNHTFDVISSSIDEVKDSRYLITLDADTIMPRDTAKSLIGAMSHILNRPCMENGKVIHGYTIMQPKVSISLESKNSTLFSKIFAGEGGVDGYSTAYSDVYEDLFAEGIFTGKGIIEIDTFYEILHDKIKDNTVLSHDLLEGELTRCALVTDAELIDNYPSSYESSCKRLHRWVRGDWQLVSWIFSRNLSLLSKWKVLDNLRRSLVAPALLLAVFLNIIMLSGTNQILILCFLGIITPLIFTVTDFVVTPKNKMRGSFKSFRQIIFIISFIPYQAYLMSDAIIRTLFRLLVSKKHLLEWQTAEETDKSTNNSLKAYIKRMWFAELSGIALIILSLNSSTDVAIVNLPLAILWIFSPYIAFYISLPDKVDIKKISQEDKEYLRDNARRIWAYYEDFVNEENNYLAPDNYQENPFKGVANRTSPTNIGMGLISNLVAYDLGYISIGEVVDRVELILNGMKKLNKYKGHYLNWYDTKNCEALWPRYVSTVDSGNLLAYLWIVYYSLIEYKEKPLVREEEILALKDTIKIAGIDEYIDIDRVDISNLKDYPNLLELILRKIETIEKGEDKEKEYWIDKLVKNIKSKIVYYDYFFDELNEKISSRKAFTKRIDNILNEIDSIMKEMDFKFLYDEKRGLFSIGYNLEEDSLGKSYYDLLASESRTTSFIAIARGEVPKEHWFKLSRAMTNAFHGKSLVSWSGTMFEYFMPSLIMKNFDNTLLSVTYSSVINAQKKFCKSKKVPWGISESAYYKFDIGENYQYKAFGVPGIGLKRGLEDELVISPYSTLMSLPFTRKDGISNLREIAKKDTYGRYGFIESIDYTPSRISKMGYEDDNDEGKNVCCYMVHHLGMSLIALDNILNNNIFQKRFHSIPEIKATELLLKEKIPENITFEHEYEYVERKVESVKEEFISRIYKDAFADNPEVLLLGNGSYSTMLTLTGSGYSKKDNMTIYRWKGDTTSDSSGMFFYIKNLNSNDYWSITYEPCKESGEDYTVDFSIDKAIYSRKDGSIKSEEQVVVSPEDDVEIRKIILKNVGSNTRTVEVTSYMEVTLQSFEGDAVHPAFSNLFIGTEYIEDEKCLLGNRRSRVKIGVVPYILHKVFVEGETEGVITYETSRINFIGRNRDLSNPSVMDNDATLSNTVGTVLDPIMSMRVPIRITPGEEGEIYYITGTANSKEDAIKISKKYSNKNIMERAFNSYNKAVQLELKSLGIKSAQANIYQSLASYILFLNSGRKDREDFIKNISKCQQDLWAYGISGDLPIVMVLAKTEEDIGFVRTMIKMQCYWRKKGLKVDLLIYNDEKANYEQPLQKSILSVLNLLKEEDVLNKPGGIFIHNNVTMPKDMRDFIIGISSLYVDSSKGSLITQIKEVEKSNISYIRHKELQDSDEVLHHFNKVECKNNNKDLGTVTLKRDANKHIKQLSFDENKLDFWNGYGGFDPKDKSYVIKLNNFSNTPAPWINVISNKNFGFHISETGSSYTWCGNSRENKITPWSNDYIMDPLSEAMYVRDDDTGDYFSITPKPVRDEGEYIINHAFGYSTFEHSVYDINGMITVFCPQNENVKIQKVVLENKSDKKRELTLYYYAQLVLGVYNYSSARYISTELRDKYIVGKNPYSKFFGNLKAYLTILGGSDLSFTGDRKEFLGINESMECPKGLTYSSLSNRVGSIYDPCLACSSKIILEPKEKKELVILLGEEEKYEKIEEKIEKYNTVEEVEKALEEIKQFWSDFLGNIQVETKDKSMDYLINGWLLYQNYSCRYLSRTAFYQSGGAYGFRDQLQDSMSLGIVRPEITKTQVLRNASRQYVEGDVQHWWHPIVNSGIRTRFSDDLLWMPYVVSEYIKRTGDYSILNEEASYLEDEPLRDGEDERYTIVNNSNKKGSIYEHCIKAIDRSLKFGEHEIPLMGSGDWNDGMSTVGNEGKGESVWLGWFIYKILDNFLDICKFMSDNDNLDIYLQMKEYIKVNLEKNAWDGGWYRRAYFDDGTPLGSRENEECQIDSLAQSWAVISGAGKKNRVIEAMESVDKNLVKGDKGMILLLAPPFEKSSLEPGYIKGYVAGVRENGGQYTHAAVWVIMALTKLGFGDKAWKYYNMINPINHTKTKLECNTYKLEPYVMAADVYIKEPHGGRGGWSWYTGAAGWMYKVGIEDILGLRQIEGKGYKVVPCVPSDWNEYLIKINNETEQYNIKVIRSYKEEVLINGIIEEDGIIQKNRGKLDIIIKFV